MPLQFFLAYLSGNNEMKKEKKKKNLCCLTNEFLNCNSLLLLVSLMKAVKEIQGVIQ